MAIFIFQVLLFGTAFLRCYAVLVVRIQNSETIAFGEGGESVVLWCHTSRFDTHATRSHTRKERCGGQHVSIPFPKVLCGNQWGNFCRYC